jgi:hypothetical protein
MPMRGFSSPWRPAGKSAVIPPRPNRVRPRDFDPDLFKTRHLIENFFCQLKQFRAIATRYGVYGSATFALNAALCDQALKTSAFSGLDEVSGMHASGHDGKYMAASVPGLSQLFHALNREDRQAAPVVRKNRSTLSGWSTCAVGGIRATARRFVAMSAQISLLYGGRSTVQPRNDGSKG